MPSTSGGRVTGQRGLEKGPLRPIHAQLGLCEWENEVRNSVMRAGF